MGALENHNNQGEKKVNQPTLLSGEQKLTFSSLLAPAGSATSGSDSITLDEHLAQRDKIDRNLSYLELLSNSAYRLISRDTRRADFDKYRENADQAGMTRTMQADREQIILEKEVAGYSCGALKTMFLFLQGRKALTGFVLVNVADSARPLDGLGLQTFDAACGTVKALSLKYAFKKLGDWEAGPVLKGMALGTSSRAIETAFSRQNYYNLKTDELEIGAGVTRIATNSVQPKALLADAIIFGTSHMMLSRLDPAIMGNRLYSTMATGGVFGMTSGALEEIGRSKRLGIPVDPLQVLKRSAISGLLDSVAAAPAGFQGRSLQVKQAREALELERRTASASEPGRIEGTVVQVAPPAEGVSLTANRPFVYEGRIYGSVEAFCQSLKFADPLRRIEVASLHGLQAEAVGKDVKPSTFEFNGRQYEYGGSAHQALVKDAIRAALQQSPELARTLSQTQPIAEGGSDRRQGGLPERDIRRILSELKQEMNPDKPKQEARVESVLPPARLEAAKPVSEVLRNIMEPEVLERHNIEAYAKAFENFGRQATEVVGAGYDSISLRLTDGNVLKIFVREPGPTMGSRPFDLPILERGTLPAGGQTINYFVQPFAQPVSQGQFTGFFDLLKGQGYEFCDPRPNQLGLHNGEARLLDYWAVRKIRRW